MNKIKEIALEDGVAVIEPGVMAKTNGWEFKPSQAGWGTHEAMLDTMVVAGVIEDDQFVTAIFVTWAPPATRLCENRSRLAINTPLGCAHLALNSLGCLSIRRNPRGRRPSR